MMRRELTTTLLAAACAASVLAQEPTTSPASGSPATQEAETTVAPRTTPGEEEAEEPPPSFPAQVEQVIVDLVVTDKKGHPVEGITKDDLILKEDGEPQSVVSFEAVELPEEPATVPAEPPEISVNTTPEAQRGRTFVIVFDDTHITPYRARDAKAAVASFLEKGVREGDYVTLISTSGGTWWTSRMNAGRDELLDTVKTFEGRYIPDNSMEHMSDWEAMRIHVYRDPQTARRVFRRFQTYGVTMRQDPSTQRDPLHGTPDDPYVTARASEVYYTARSRYRVTLDALERAAGGLTNAKGRKSIILVSEGFIYDPSVEDFKEVTEACRRANAAIYFVNARGLEGMPTYMTAQFGPPLPQQDIGFVFAETQEAAGGSEEVAAESGGFTIRNTNDLEGAIQRIAEETRIYYLLGYIPTNTARDGKFREIEVEFKKGRGDDLKIRARKGYYAPAPDGSRPATTKPGVDPVIQTALDSPWAEDGIPLRMTHYVGAEKMLGKAEVLIVTEVDIRGLHFEEVDGRDVASIEFLLVVAHRESGEYFRYDQTIDMKLRPSTHERLKRLWFPIIRDFELQPGDHQAKMVIREVSTGVVGSVIHDFDVPPLGQFRVSTPIITDIHRPNTDGPGVKPQLVARRAFPEGSEVVCSFEVFGATRDESGMPQVLQGYKVERSDGVVLSGMPESMIQPTSLGALSRLIGFSLRGATPGQYEMQLTFQDELSGETIDLHEPFRVVPAEEAGDADGPSAPSS
jgi:VWFA-related protein